MMRKCHLNTCPVGVCTQDPVLRAKFAGTPEHVINYLFLVAEEVREILASLGFHKLNDAIGRADLLEPNPERRPAVTAEVDLSPILTPGVRPNGSLGAWTRQPQRHKLEHVLDRELIRLAGPALTRREPVVIERAIKNENRTTGTLLSHELVKRHGGEGLPEGTIELRFTGSAGQSLGAWLARGVSIDLEGDANDYVGKGLSGGRIVVRPPKEAPYVPEENVIIGNVALYGATSGEAFFHGLAGERFCVRNSGANAVVEGVGEHGCEYMTGGRAVILGPTRRNFAAGMSGGIAFVWDPHGEFPRKCNQDLVELGRLDRSSKELREDERDLRRLVEAHVRYTGSGRASALLARWDEAVKEFVRVIPTDFRKVRERRAKEALENQLHPVRSAAARSLPVA
jgi:glutamate synthase (NADPH/NADH) large chain